MLVKLNGNPSKGSGAMICTRNSEANHMTLECDLDLESA